MGHRVCSPIACILLYYCMCALLLHASFFAVSGLRGGPEPEQEQYCEIIGERLRWRWVVSRFVHHPDSRGRKEGKNAVEVLLRCLARSRVVRVRRVSPKHDGWGMCR